MPTDRLVNAETLEAAMDAAGITLGDRSRYAAILAAIPPDPRLDALLAAARTYVKHYGYPMKGIDVQLDALSDALAAFEEKVPYNTLPDFGQQEVRKG